MSNLRFNTAIECFLCVKQNKNEELYEERK